MASDQIRDFSSNRLRVIVPCAIAALIVATGLCMVVAIKVAAFDPALLKIWYSVLSGPFAATWMAPDQTGWVTYGTINAFLLVAHPVRPSRLTAFLTVGAVVSWIFCGTALAFTGV